MYKIKISKNRARNSFRNPDKIINIDKDKDKNKDKEKNTNTYTSFHTNNPSYKTKTINSGYHNKIPSPTPGTIYYYNTYYDN
jgi:hypothetical protein